MGNPFLIETLKQIGQKISNTKKSEIQGEPKKEEKKEEKPQEEEKEKEEKQYLVYANINSSEEDFSFLLTALYHWETLYPTFTLLLPKDPAEIVVVAPKKKDQDKEKDKEESNKKSEDKKEEAQPPSDQLSHAESQVQKLMANMAEIDSNSDLQELINI